MRTMNGTGETIRTSGFIDTIGCDTQNNADHFGKVVIQDYVDKVKGQHAVSY